MMVPNLELQLRDALDWRYNLRPAKRAQIPLKLQRARSHGFVLAVVLTENDDFCLDDISKLHCLKCLLSYISLLKS